MKNKLNNEGGFIFVTVLTIIFVMMIVAVSILSMNISQTMVTEKEVDRIQAEVLAGGVLGYSMIEKTKDPNFTSKTLTKKIDNTTFSVTTTIAGNPSGSYQTNPLSVQVSY